MVGKPTQKSIRPLAVLSVGLPKFLGAWLSDDALSVSAGVIRQARLISPN